MWYYYLSSRQITRAIISTDSNLIVSLFHFFSCLYYHRWQTFWRNDIISVLSFSLSFPLAYSEINFRERVS